MKKYLVLEESGNFKTVFEENYDSTLELLQKNVQGYIERVSFYYELEKRGIDLWVNEEGKLNDLLPTVVFIDSNDNLLEVLNGNIVFSKFDDEGDTLPLEEEDIHYIKETFTKHLIDFSYNNIFTGNRLSNHVSVVQL